MPGTQISFNNCLKKKDTTWRLPCPVILKALLLEVRCNNPERIRSHSGKRLYHGKIVFLEIVFVIPELSFSKSSLRATNFTYHTERNNMGTIDFQRLPEPFPEPRCLLQRILCLGKWSHSRLAATMAMTKHFQKNSALTNLL